MTIQSSPSFFSAHHAFLSIFTLCKHGRIHDALDALELMNQQGLPLSSDMVYSVIQACAEKKDLLSARRLPSLIDRSGLGSITFLKDNLIRLFAACRSLHDAYTVFLHVLQPTNYTWNSIISAYTQCGHGQEALAMYANMKEAKIEPDKVTFLSIIRACSSVGYAGMARKVHDEVIRFGLEEDVNVGNTLLAMYAKCQSLAESLFIFNNISNHNVVTWSALISGFANHNQGLQALQHFERMQSQGISPNVLTFSSVMKACGTLQAIDCSYEVHDMFVRANLRQDLVIGSTLVDMYSRCGSMKDARHVFDALESRDLVSWGAMITGYTMQEDSLGALELFEKMERQNIKPNRVIFLSAIKACGYLRAVHKGKAVHNKVIESCFESDIAVGSALMDMYVKCHSLDEARNVLKGLRNKDAVIWGSLVAGYAVQGSSESAWQCLEEMQKQGVKPGNATFTVILAACGRSGFLEGGHQYVQKIHDFGITLTFEHLGCMVDLFARAGKLEEAEAILSTIPVSPDVIFWRSLLTCCKIHSNLDVGKRCFDEARIIHPGDASLYTLMSNIYAALNRWEDVDYVENLRMCAGAHKMPGRACIEIDGRVHEFIVSDKSQLHSYGVLPKFCRMVRTIKHDEAFVPYSESVLSLLLQDVEDGS